MLSNFSRYSQTQPASSAAEPAAPFSPPASSESSRRAGGVSAGSGGSIVGAYLELCKARLSALVVVTSGAGFLLAGHPVDWFAFAGAVTGTSLAAASANTFNQVWERAPDALMRRTAGRPLPTGRLSVRAALSFGAATGAASAALLLATTNALTAALGVGNIALYALVYTPLKRVSVWNTAVGALVGAVPPLMGWAAATGGLAAVDPFLAAFACFAWQFPHFYALAWPLRRDYARGGYAMAVCADASGARTAQLITRNALALAAVPPAAALMGVASPMFAVEGALLNGYLLLLARRFARDRSDAAARRVFLASLWYLPLLLGLLIFHATHWRSAEEAAARGQQRGVTWGDAAEHAIGAARALGRQACAHEIFAAPHQLAPPPLPEAGGAHTAGAAGAPAPACPVVLAEHGVAAVRDAVAEEAANRAAVLAARASKRAL